MASFCVFFLEFHKFCHI